MNLRDKSFDIILISAIWMQLSPQEQSQSSQTIRTLLNDNGLIITLRNVDFSDCRRAFKIDSNGTMDEAKQLIFITQISRSIQLENAWFK